MVSGVVFHRREPVRVPEKGIVHPRDAVKGTAHYVPFLTQSILLPRIKTIAHYIAKDYHGKHLQLIPILNGALPFTQELLKLLQKEPLKCSMEPVHLASYTGMKAGEIKVIKDITKFHSTSVLIVEDIVERGCSVKFLIDHLRRKGITDIGVCTLLYKKSKTEHILPLQYVGFEIPDVWVVGFGMDYNEKYRDLGYVGKLVG